MRIAGVMIVRNDEDIVEASIRHNARVVDRLAVVDHGSTDETPAILAALVAEGLPIDVRRDDSLAYHQSAMTTAEARRGFGSGADLVIPVDADEFIRMPSRDAFERAVANADPSLPLTMPCRSYLPDLDGAGDIVARLAHAKRAAGEHAGTSKVIVRRSSLDDPGAAIANGNHAVRTSGAKDSPHVALPGSVASMAHVPVRGVDQFMGKVTVGWLSRLLAQPDDPAPSPLRAEFDAIMAGKRPTHERLASIVAGYGLPDDRRDNAKPIAWVEDPFLDAIGLRYSPRRAPMPLSALLAFGERVAAEVAKATGGV